jgi:hypothetical protein
MLSLSNRKSSNATKSVLFLFEDKPPLDKAWAYQPPCPNLAVFLERADKLGLLTILGREGRRGKRNGKARELVAITIHD